MKIIHLLLVCSILTPSYLLADEMIPPFIKFETDHHELVLTEQMNEALTAYNPQFKAWKTTDYSKSIVESLMEYSENTAPFAFIIDINQDGKADVIIDGFNGKMPEIIAILSNEESYQVIHIDSLHTHSDPSLVTSSNEGVIEYGLNYLLWPNRNPETPLINIFTVVTPQETDPDGELLSDGGLTDYHFIEGKFVAFYPEF
jgi:hypothetical protein